MSYENANYGLSKSLTRLSARSRSQNLSGLGYSRSSSSYANSYDEGGAQMYDTGMGFFLFSAIASVASAAASLVGKAVGSVASTVVGAVKSVITGASKPQVQVHTSAGTITVDTSDPAWETKLHDTLNGLGVSVTFGNPQTGQTISLPGGMGQLPSWVIPAGIGVVALLLLTKRR